MSGFIYPSHFSDKEIEIAKQLKKLFAEISQLEFQIQQCTVSDTLPSCLLVHVAEHHKCMQKTKTQLESLISQMQIKHFVELSEFEVIQLLSVFLDINQAELFSIYSKKSRS